VATNGAGGSALVAQGVVDEIIAGGGEAFASAASVTDYAQIKAMVAETVERWGKIDILINNAGILRDKTFAKMSLEDFRLVVDVHLMGAANCTKAVWDGMRARNYGRVVMTTSSSGLYGNFGQSNYGAAKMALVGFMQTLALEGAKHNIRVSCLAPTAATRMLDGLLPPEKLALLGPDVVSPGMLALVCEDAPTKTILMAGAGSFEQAHITMTRGLFIGKREDAAEEIAAHWADLANKTGETQPEHGMRQGELELAKAGLSSTIISEV
jgi:NAD(P)-dependent dehydrogenase (short-subunit alcohol dehydrogenase family)